MVIHAFFIITCFSFFTSVCSQIIIKDAGIAMIQPNDIAMIFYLTLNNMSPVKTYVSVRGVSCCQMNPFTEKHDCESMKLLGSDSGILKSGAVKNITLIYANLYLYDLQGFCSVVVVYQIHEKTEHIFYQIDFNSRNKFIDTDLKKNSCYGPDLDSYRNCTPVDCSIKYSGVKNFFNSINKYCEPVPYCRSCPGKQEMYNMLRNRCEDLSKTINCHDLVILEERKATTGAIPFIYGNVVCHHGKISPDTGECICDPKWISTLINEPEFFPTLIGSHMCNIETGSWTELNKDKLALTILALVVMTSLCVLKIFFIICLLHFCYKWARSRGRTCSIDDGKSAITRDLYRSSCRTDSCQLDTFCLCRKADAQTITSRAQLLCACETKPKSSRSIHKSLLLCACKSKSSDKKQLPALRTVDTLNQPNCCCASVECGTITDLRSTTQGHCLSNEFVKVDEIRSTESLGSSDESSDASIDLSYSGSEHSVVTFVSQNTSGFKGLTSKVSAQTSNVMFSRTRGFEELELECTSSDGDSLRAIIE